MKKSTNKTKKRLAIAMISVICLALILSACGSGTQTKENASTQSVESTVAAGDTSAQTGKNPPIEKLENPNVSIIAEFDIDQKVKDYFEEKWGGKLNVTVAAWNVMNSKIIASAAAGKPTDVIFMFQSAFPKLVTKNILQPVDQYFDLKDPIFDQGCSSQISWKGERYGVCSFQEPGASYVWYNKTLFEDNGLETPTEQYNKGEWSLENFQKDAVALTQDTNGDGKTDLWGLNTWMLTSFLSADGGQIVTYDKEKGSINLTINDSKVKYGLNFLQDGKFKYKYFGGDFYAGTCAMTVERSWVAWYLASLSKDKKIAFEWDFVPFPIGPDNKTGVVEGDCKFYGISKGAENPKGGAAFLYAWFKYIYDHRNDVNPENVDPRTPEQKERMTDCNSRVYIPLVAGIGNLDGKMGKFFEELNSSTPLATLLAKYTPIFQSEIDTCIQDTKEVKSIPFQPVPVIDFENGKLDEINYQGMPGTASANITTDSKEVLDGKSSLKVVASKGAEDQVMLNTLPDKLVLPAYHVYKITFDYKVLEDIPEDGYYFVTIRPKNSIAEDKVSFGKITFNGKKAGETGKFEDLIAIDRDASDCCIVLGGKNVGSIVIDNLNVTEQ